MQRKKNEQVTNLKNKIKRLSKGDFHIPQPEIIFPETRIIMRVGEGEMYKGSFSLQNQGEGTIRDSGEKSFLCTSRLLRHA